MTDDALYAKAVAVVHERQIASITLVERCLKIPYAVAMSLMDRMSQETTFVRRLPTGLFEYTANALAAENATLHRRVQDLESQLGICREALADAERELAAANRELSCHR
ncbi:DNA translocase FtsK [Cupriavidus basilensis]|uniref:DNA translocase FtsK n=1 Tax=Cupriavidus basilensis TaxID=68895 RepID=UPI0005BB2737|nr:DNA translocase FtsK [Cupriavidus basilensis]